METSAETAHHGAQANKLGLTDIQLHDMEKDPGQRTNGQTGHAEVVAGLTQLLKDHVAKGRSTPGAALKNDIEAIDIWKKRGK